MAGWLRRAPVSSLAAVLLLLAAAAHRLLTVAPGDASDLSAVAAHPDRPWTLLTAWLGPSTTTPWAGVVLLLVVGAAVERVLGSRRFTAVAMLCHAIGVAVVMASLPLITALRPVWGEAITHLRVNGVGLILLGPLLAATALMDSSCRRRTRVVLVTGLVILAGVTGTPTALARLGAALSGLAAGVLLRRGADTRPRLPGTGRSAHNLLALLTSAWAAVTALTVVSHLDAGPLAEVRYGILPIDRSVGGGTVVLALMPMVLQLVLADGLRRGRRAAAIGTITLQLHLALCAAAGVASHHARQGMPVRLSSHHWYISSHLALPLLLNLALVLLVVWNRDHLGLQSRSCVVRKTAVVLVGVVLGCGAVAALAGQVASGITPGTTTSVLVTEYIAHLLPASVTPLVAGLAPVPPAAHAVVTWICVVAWTGIVTTVWAALRQPVDAPSARREALTALVRTNGAGTLGWMLTWPGNETWISPDGATGFSYRRSNGVALTLGDPAAEPEDVAAAVEGFAAFAADSGLVPALYSVHGPTMQVARDNGWTVLQIAEEAVLDLPDLAFRGKAFQDVRTALNHAKREGVIAVWTTWRSAPAGYRDQIRTISRDWAQGKSLPEMGFTLGGLREIDDDDTRLLLAVDADGTVQAVTSWMPVHRRGEVVGLTLDVMRRREGGWRPAVEFLIARAALDAQAEGLETLSLSAAPLARSTGSRAEDLGTSRLNRFLDVLASLLEPAYGFGSLHAFKRKFKPRPAPMYLAVPSVIDLAAVGVAIGRAYLPDLTPAQTARFAQVLVSQG